MFQKYAACAIGLIGLAFVGGALAQQDVFTGQFRATEGSADARISQRNGAYFATFQTAAGSCSGSVEGPARVKGDTLVMEAPFDNNGRRGVCRITMTRRGAGYVVDEQNCTYFHGAACEFAGAMRRESAALRWRSEGMAIDGQWKSEYDLGWVSDQYGNGLVLMVSGCRDQSYDITLGVRTTVNGMTVNHSQAAPQVPQDPWTRELGSLRSATLRPLDAGGKALATITLPRDEVHRLRAELRPAEVAAIRSASRLEVSSSLGTTYFGARGSSRVIETLNCLV